MDRLEYAPQIRVLIKYFTSEEVPYEQAYVPLQPSLTSPLAKDGKSPTFESEWRYWNPRGTNKNNYLPDSRTVKQLKSRECGTFYDL